MEGGNEVSEANGITHKAGGNSRFTFIQNRLDLLDRGRIARMIFKLQRTQRNGRYNTLLLAIKETSRVLFLTALNHSE
ncbi:MAG: hypothetical protein IJQ39_06665 [Thermoguttaceae bacterium]|nr:hypothetical protein [Thermoguttaceae bacterium]